MPIGNGIKLLVLIEKAVVIRAGATSTLVSHTFKLYFKTAIVIRYQLRKFDLCFR